MINAIAEKMNESFVKFHSNIPVKKIVWQCMTYAVNHASQLGRELNSLLSDRTIWSHIVNVST